MKSVKYNPKCWYEDISEAGFQEYRNGDNLETNRNVHYTNHHLRSRNMEPKEAGNDGAQQNPGPNNKKDTKSANNHPKRNLIHGNRHTGYRYYSQAKETDNEKTTR